MMGKDIYEAFVGLLEQRLTAAIEAGEWDILFRGVSAFTLIGIQRAIEQQNRILGHSISGRPEGQVTAKISALEKAPQGVVAHQTETAQLLQELAEKIEAAEPPAV